jgi:hypothetical protein
MKTTPPSNAIIAKNQIFDSWAWGVLAYSSFLPPRLRRNRHSDRRNGAGVTHYSMRAARTFAATPKSTHLISPGSVLFILRFHGIE